MEVVLTVLAILLVLLGSEFWWRRSNIHGEFSRKFIHITVGSFVACWPFFLSWHQIGLLSLAFLVVISISKYLNLFQAIHSVQRPTWGEVFFAGGVGLTTLISHDKWIFATAILMMGLADGVAAVIGVRYGGRQRYSVFGYAKSIVGTVAFFFAAVAILLAYNHFGDQALGPAALLGLSALATLVENVAIGGLDNLLVPVIVALILANR